MKKQIRLDKYLSESSGESRSEVKNWLKKGRIRVNGEMEKDPGRKISPEEDQVCLDGKKLRHEEFHYLMLHKPAGVVSATRDSQDKTVLDLVMEKNLGEQPFGMAVYENVFPVGRLDKDTEGLLIMTDDGDLAHRLLSPKKHVDKTYYALLDGPIGEAEKKAFWEGLDIGDEKKTLPALLRPAVREESPEGREEEGYGVMITIREGRYHQIKRMARAVGREVLYLKRISMGKLHLDPELKAGDCRLLTQEEINQLKM